MPDSDVRAFVAVVPPEDVLNQMEDFIGARLRPAARYKWVTRAQLHITLRFLGEAPPSKIEAVAEALAGAAAFPRFDIRLDRAGGFPSLARPRALWLGVGQGENEGEKSLEALAAKVEKASVAAGFPPETKKFQPHLTLARLRTPEPLSPELEKALNAVPVFFWRCESFCLVKSDLRPEGPIYTVLKEYPLT
jgi:2'-5' RNA ligase